MATQATKAVIKDGAVTTAKVADAAITGVKIAAGVVDATKIAAGAVGTTELAGLGVTTAKLADLNVTTAKLANLNVTTGKVADGAVTTAKVANAAISTAKLADAAITGVKIAAGVVTYDKLDPVLTGPLTLKGADTTTDGGSTNSPLFSLTGTYDSDGTTAVLSATRKLSFRNTVAADGSYQLDILDNAGAVAASVLPSGILVVADPTAATHALNRQTGDNRYARVTTYSGDLNTLLTEGLHYCDGTSTNRPTASDGFALVQVIDASNAIQRFQPKNANTLYSRLLEAGVWGAWTEVTGSSVSDPAYTAVSTFYNSWVNVGGEWATAGYRKLDDGTVQLRGTIKSGTASHAFTLPAGHHPAESIIFPASTSADVYGQFKIAGAGNADPGFVYIQVYSSSWFSLGEVSFRGV